MQLRQREVRQTSIDKRDNYIHIETKGCVINIYPCLHTSDGRPATTVEVLPDFPDWVFDTGASLTRVAQRSQEEPIH